MATDEGFGEKEAGQGNRMTGCVLLGKSGQNKGPLIRKHSLKDQSKEMRMCKYIEQVCSGDRKEQTPLLRRCWGLCRSSRPGGEDALGGGARDSIRSQILQGLVLSVQTVCQVS